MSTLPGSDAWRDAGLSDDEEIVNLVDEASAEPVSKADYHPRTPRPDLEGRATEADVVDQAAAVPAPDEDYA